MAFLNNILNAKAGNATSAYAYAAGAPSGIHFGRGIFDIATGYFEDNGTSSTLNIEATGTGTDGNVLMYDPLTVEAYRGTTDTGTAAFVMNVKAGAGEFIWGGKNVLDANGGSTVTLASGSKTTLAHDFTLTTTPGIEYRTGSATDAYAMASSGNTNDLTVEIKNGSTLNFNLARDANAAMFDFTNASNKGDAGAWTFDGVNLGISTDRQLIDVNQKYLIADGIHNDNRDASTSAGIGLDKTQDGQLWTETVVYNSSHDSLFRQNINSSRAAEALNYVLQDRIRVSNAEFDAILANANAVTAEYYASRGVVALQTVGTFANTALNRGSAFPNNWRGPCSLSPYHTRGAAPRANLTRHIWGGYLGEFGTMDRHSRREEYQTTMHGLFVGTDWQLTRDTIFGIYGGFMDETLKYDTINSRVDSDGMQIGVFAHRHLGSGNVLSADFGYAHFDNDGRRILSGFTTRAKRSSVAPVRRRCGLTA